MSRKPQGRKGKEQLRLMSYIRTNIGQIFLIVLLVVMAIGVFAGLGLGTFDFGTMGSRAAQGTQKGLMPHVTLDDSGELKDVALRINGRAVDNEYFQAVADNFIQNYARGKDDPQMMLMAYGAAAGRALRQEMILALGEERGVKVSRDDIEKAKDELIQQYMTPDAADSEESGNIFGDFAKKLGSSRERNDAFTAYLQSQGLSEDEWLKRVERETMERNTTQALQDEANEKKKLAMSEKRALIDQKLAEGAKFEDIVREYSEDQDTASVEKGGDVGAWVKRGLLTIPEQEEVLFATPKGEISDWIEIPAGLQKFEVYDKVEASGPEFEAAKEGIISTIRGEKGADYEPTEDEIKKSYEQVKFRKLQLSNEDLGAADVQVNELFEKAVIEINDPYVLAYQALFDQKLQPVATLSFEELTEIARQAPVAEGYKFELIEAKLENGKPKEAGAADEADAETAADGAAAVDADATATEELAAEITDTDESPDTAAADDEAPTVNIELPEDMGGEDDAEAANVDAAKPAYALAIGLLTAALTSQGEEVIGSFPYMVVADTYMRWLDDETTGTDQPVDRTKAREEAEKFFARAAERDEYSAKLHASRGLNLAWLERPEEAKASLKLALEYAPSQPGGPLETVKEAYEVLGDDEGLRLVTERLDVIRQEQLRMQLEQAMKQSEEQGAPMQVEVGGGPGSGQAAPQGTAPPAGQAPPQGGE